MSPRLTRLLEADPSTAPVEPKLQALVRLAAAVTDRPAEVCPAAVVAAADGLSAAQYLDAAGVIFGFNFVTRVANALGVAPEIPGWMRRLEPLRQLGLRIMAAGFRVFVDLRHRRIKGPRAEDHLAGLHRLFADLGLGPAPVWFDRLAAAPAVLASVRECMEALIRQGGPAGTIAVAPDQFLGIARVALEAIGPAVGPLRTSVDEWWARYPGPVPADDRTRLVERFARDVTFRSYTLTADRVGELTRAGLTDAEVLDVTVTAAVWNAALRLEILVESLPDAWFAEQLPGDPRVAINAGVH